MGLWEEGECERLEVSLLVTDAVCIEILETAVREGVAEIECFGVTKSLKEHLRQACARLQQQGDHRFDDLTIDQEQNYLTIYQRQHGPWGPNGGAQFIWTADGIVRC